MDIDEPFSINLRDRTMLVIPQDDGTFDIYEGEHLYCNIFADIGIDTEPIWATSDLVAKDIVDEIGYAIEMKQM
jgi:hypothetical protein